MRSLDEQIKEAAQKYVEELPYTFAGFHAAEVELIFCSYQLAFEVGARMFCELGQEEMRERAAKAADEEESHDYPGNIGAMIRALPKQPDRKEES